MSKPNSTQRLHVLPFRVPEQFLADTEALQKILRRELKGYLVSEMRPGDAVAVAMRYVVRELEAGSLTIEELLGVE